MCVVSCESQAVSSCLENFSFAEKGEGNDSGCEVINFYVSDFTHYILWNSALVEITIERIYRENLKNIMDNTKIHMYYMPLTYSTCMENFMMTFGKSRI